MSGFAKSRINRVKHPLSPSTTDKREAERLKQEIFMSHKDLQGVKETFEKEKQALIQEIDGIKKTKEDLNSEALLLEEKIRVERLELRHVEESTAEQILELEKKMSLYRERHEAQVKRFTEEGEMRQQEYQHLYQKVLDAEQLLSQTIERRTNLLLETARAEKLTTEAQEKHKKAQTSVDALNKEVARMNLLVEGKERYLLGLSGQEENLTQSLKSKQQELEKLTARVSELIAEADKRIEEQKAFEKVLSDHREAVKVFEQEQMEVRIAQKALANERARLNRLKRQIEQAGKTL